MTPGPKPSGMPKRQTLGVAVQPWTLDELDGLILQFKYIEEYLPQWFKLPNTRSSAAAWILERCARSEIDKLILVIRTCTNHAKTLKRDAIGIANKEDVKKMFEDIHTMQETIKADEFFNSLYDLFSKTLEKQTISELKNQDS